MATESVELPFKFKSSFKDATFFDVDVLKHRRPNANHKILFVLDHVPSEDLRSGRLLSGPTRDVFNMLATNAHDIYGSDFRLRELDWLVINFNCFKTYDKTDDYKQAAHQEFTRRLQWIIAEYKPDVVMTFGREPFQGLNLRKIQYANGAWQNFFGTTIPTTVDYRGNKHTFQHVPTLSLDSLLKPAWLKDTSNLLGYISRNMLTALNGKMKYKVPKLYIKDGSGKLKPRFKVETLKTLADVKRVMAKMAKAEITCIDTEAESLNKIVNKIQTFQISADGKTAYIIPIYHFDTPFSPKELRQIISILRDFFETKNSNKYQIYTNAKFDLNLMRTNFGVRYYKADVWDIIAGEFGLDENMKVLATVAGGGYYGLGNQAMQYGCSAFLDAEFGKENRKVISSTPLRDDVLEYCALDVIVPFWIVKEQIKRAKVLGYSKYELLISKQISDQIHTFSVLEHTGALADVDYLFELKFPDSPINTIIRDLEVTIYESPEVAKVNKVLARQDNVPKSGLFGAVTAKLFDLSKSEHKQILFFDVMKLKPVKLSDKKKRPNGEWEGNLDKNFQSAYKDKKPLVKAYSELQAAYKLRNAYVNSLIKQWASADDFKHDRRLRPEYSYQKVVTGRTSASNPNLQQIPSRSELGKHIKRLFIADNGKILIKVDYSAHEVRCFSLYSYLSTELGMVQFRDFLAMPDKPLVHSFNHDTGQTELKPAGTQSIHPPEEDMYEIEYEGGTITVTGNHKLWSKTRNAYIRADEIQEDEELLVDAC